MKITFFSVDPYGKIVGEELKRRGYDIKINEVDENTDICFIMCCPSAFEFEKYLANRWDLERFLYRGKTVYNVLDIPVWRLDEPNWKSFYKKYMVMLTKADYITTISKITSEQLKLVWNLDSEPLFRVFDNKRVEKYVTTEKDDKLIVAVSRFVPHKRFELVIKALEGTDMKLVLIGKSGPMSSFYKQLAEQLKVPCTIYHNPDDRLTIQHLCMAKVVVHPSVFEGLSMVPKEALWCNTPVIISDIPVHREYHKDSVTYCIPNSLKDLKKKIMEVPMNPEQGRKLMEEFTIEKTTDKVEKWLIKHLK